MMSQADGASHSPEEGLVTQKQFSYIRCVLSQGLCSVLCILDCTSDQLTPISLGHSQRRTASEIIVPQPGIEPRPSSESSEPNHRTAREFLTFPVLSHSRNPSSTPFQFQANLGRRSHYISNSLNNWRRP